jgi:hypothetical protein
MPSIDDIYSGNTLKATDIKGRVVTVTIENVVKKAFEQKDGTKKTKLVLEFIGKNKGFVVNATNARIIADICGSDYSQWPGQTISLGTHMTPMGDGICVMDPARQDRIETGVQPRRSVKNDLDDTIPF